MDNEGIGGDSINDSSSSDDYKSSIVYYMLTILAAGVLLFLYFNTSGYSIRPYVDKSVEYIATHIKQVLLGILVFAVLVWLIITLIIRMNFISLEKKRIAIQERSEMNSLKLSTHRE
jgi:hypothetical protein